MFSCRVSSLFLFFVLAVSPAAHMQVRPQQHEDLRASMERNEDAQAARILNQIAARSVADFARNNYDYLLGRLLERRGANAEAAAAFHQVIERNSPLTGYAIWHRAEIARAAGNLPEEQRMLSRLITQHPDHLYRERAIVRLADSQYKTGQYQNVISTLRLLGGPRRDVAAMIGAAQAGLRQTEAARATFESVLASGALDDASLRACEGLDRLDEAAMATISEADRLRRARVYQYNRHFAEARAHWQALVRYYPNSTRRAETLFQIGRGYFLENNFAEALKWYQRVYEEFPQTEEGEQGFYYAGHCYQFMDDTDRAIARYEAYLKEFPEGSFIGYAHLNAIDTLRSGDRLEEALQWATRAQTVTREPFIATSALFQQARIRLTQENYRAALADFSLLKSRNLNVRGLTASTNLPEVSYMRGYCLQKLGRNEEAVIEFLSLTEGRNGPSAYYGWRASERLRSMAGNPATRAMLASWREKYINEARAASAAGNALQAKNAANQALRLLTDAGPRDELLRILRAAYSKLPGYQIPSISVAAAGRTAPLDPGAPAAAGASHQTIANELLFLGLYDEGASELLAAGPLTQTTAYYCSRGPCAHRTLDLAEPWLKRLPEDLRLEVLPDQLAEMFYPMPYRDSLARHATSRMLDLRFVLSIIRQESSYETRIKSGSAARGMMQFIASTANQIAAQLALPDFEQNDLYEPDTAILFGSQYIKNLNDEFGSGQAVAAAYNGSEESVRRWRARARSKEVDRLVIEIAKRETKDYIFKVMNNYNAYRTIYANR
jgi:soluble lytic murein transglycosylase